MARMALAATGHIVSAEDRYLAHSSHPEHSPPEAVVFRHWRHGIGAPAQMHLQMKGEWPTELTGVLARAYVNHGSWMVDCPFGPRVVGGPPCCSAQFASKDDPRFFCIDCGRGWAEVVWPADPDAIEAALIMRPASENRNWYPHETVAELRAENEVHGL